VVIKLIILFVILIIFPGIMLVTTEAVIPSISLLFLDGKEKEIMHDALNNNGRLRIHEWNLMHCTIEIINSKKDYFYFKTPSFPIGFVIELCCKLYNLFGYVYRMYCCRKYDICVEKNEALTWNIDKYVNFFKSHNYECYVYNRKIKSSYKDIYMSSVPSICISNEANITFKMIIGQNLRDH